MAGSKGGRSNRSRAPSRAPPRRRAAAPKRASRAPPRRMQGRGRSVSRASTMSLGASASGYSGRSVLTHLTDARSRAHIPPAMAQPAYTVMRTRDTLSVSTPTNTSDFRVLLFGEYGYTELNVSNAAVLPLIGIVGDGANVPGVTEGAVECVDIANITAQQPLARLHALTVTVTCTDPVTSARGVFYAGTMPGPVHRIQFANWNAVGNAIVARLQAKQHSAYGSMEFPVCLGSVPMDVAQWNMLETLMSTPPNLSLRRATDTLQPIAVVLPGQSSAVNYSVTVVAEWRVVFAMTDARSSLHEFRNPTPAPLVAAAQQAVANAAGSLMSSVISSAAGTLTRPRRPRRGARSSDWNGFM